MAAHLFQLPVGEHPLDVREQQQRLVVAQEAVAGQYDLAQYQGVEPGDHPGREAEPPFVVISSPPGLCVRPDRADRAGRQQRQDLAAGQTIVWAHPGFVGLRVVVGEQWAWGRRNGTACG